VLLLSITYLKGKLMIKTVLLLDGLFNRKTSSAAPQKIRRDFVIPAWNAGIQIDMDVSGRPANLDAGSSCRHDRGETRAVPHGLSTLAESFVFIFDRLFLSSKCAGEIIQFTESW
jgi:hypothetical protein